MDISRREFLRKGFYLAGGGAAGLAYLNSVGIGPREAAAIGIVSHASTSPSGGACTVGNDSDCKLLIHSNTTDGSTTFVDSSLGGTDHSANITANGGVHHETDEQKFGTTSIDYGAIGDADYLSVATHADFDIRDKDIDWTIEFWLFINSKGTLMYAMDSASGLLNSLVIQIEKDSDLYFGSSEQGIGFSVAITIANPLTTSTWHHIAVCNDSATIRMYVDGVQGGTDTLTADLDLTSYDLFFGANFNGVSPLDGYQDEIRFSNGVCRYPNGTTFTPPTLAYCDS